MVTTVAHGPGVLTAADPLLVKTYRRARRSDLSYVARVGLFGTL